MAANALLSFSSRPAAYHGGYPTNTSINSSRTWFPRSSLQLSSNSPHHHTTNNSNIPTTDHLSIRPSLTSPQDGRPHRALLPAAKANGTDQRTKPNSIVCADCDGNGAVLCSQCEGSGVNTIDHFNGRFKAGQLCWLCRGKREILCGNCNGAGFVGGFLSE